VRSQHLLRVGLVYLNLNPGYRGSNQLDIVCRIAQHVADVEISPSVRSCAHYYIYSVFIAQLDKNLIMASIG
jgi:hypothetical protein